MSATNDSYMLTAKDRLRLERIVAAETKLAARKRAAVAEIAAKGGSLREMATVLRVSHTAVYKWIREA